MVPRLVAVLVLLALAGSALAIATEHFDNHPIKAQEWNFREDVVAVANLPSRHYWVEINGDPTFLFRGDTDALNVALKRFAEVAGEKEIVLVPGPAEAKTLMGKPLECDWKLHAPAGLYAATLKEKGTHVTDHSPVLTVFVRRDVTLKQIALPAGVPVIGVGELLQRNRDGLKSPDPMIHGLAAGNLGALAAYADDVVPTLIEQCKPGQHEYVRRSAAGALFRLGRQAAPALEVLKKGADDPDVNIRNAFAEAAKHIEAAPEVPDQKERDQRRRQDRAAIEQFLKTRGR